MQNVIDPLSAKLHELCQRLSEGLVERDQPVQLALLAALAGEHLLLLGPPGTAKSLVARRLRLAFAEATYFERLLTRFTVPEELFGPLSIRGLEQDRYERLTEAYLPTASIAFLDEIFKANSAILNALLTLLNEREFDNGARREPTPLVAVIAASNEIPEPGELDALFDRFLVRLDVGPVSSDAFPLLLRLRGNPLPELSEALKLRAADLTALQELAEEVEIPPDVIALLGELRNWCVAKQIQVSDRRWRKIAKLLQVAAFTNGRTRVSVWDCWLVQHCVWNRPEDRGAVYEWYADRVGASAVMDPARLTRVVTAWEATLRSDRESRSQMRDRQGHLLFTGPDGKPARESRAQKCRGTEPLFLAPAKSQRLVGSAYREAYEIIQDRTNSGRGYTADELNDLRVAGKGSSHSPFRDWAERERYLGNPAHWLVEAERAPAMEPTRHKQVHIQACLQQLGDLAQEVEAYRAKLLNHIASLQEEIHGHLWVPADFAGPASASLLRTREQVEALLARVGTLREGFQALPREADPPIPGVDLDDGPTAVAQPEAGSQE